MVPMLNSRLISPSALVGAIVVFISLVYAFAPSSGGFLTGDFNLFYQAAERMRAGEALYIPDPGGLAYQNPAFFAWMLQPLTFIPHPVARRLWTVLTYGLVLLSSRLLLGGKASTPGRRFWLWGSVLSIPVFVGNLLYGQNTAIVLFSFAVFYTLAHRGHGAWAGLVLALGLIKPHLVIGPAVTLLAARQWRELAGLVGGAVVLGGLSLALIGESGLRTYRDIANDSLWSAKYGAFWRQDLHTPNGVLHEFLPPLMADVGLVLTSGLVIGLIAWRSNKERRVGAETFSMAVVGGLLITPFSHVHDLMLLMIPWLLLEQAPSRPILWVRIASYLAPVGHLIVIGIGGFGPLLTVSIMVALFGVLVGTPSLPEKGVR